MRRLRLQIAAEVDGLVAQHSVNPANLEAAIRKTLLPDLFRRIGMDRAKAALDQIVRDESHISTCQDWMATTRSLIYVSSGCGGSGVAARQVAESRSIHYWFVRRAHASITWSSMSFATAGIMTTERHSVDC